MVQSFKYAPKTETDRDFKQKLTIRHSKICSSSWEIEMPKWNKACNKILLENLDLATAMKLEKDS